MWLIECAPYHAAVSSMHGAVEVKVNSIEDGKIRGFETVSSCLPNSIRWFGSPFSSSSESRSDSPGSKLAKAMKEGTLFLKLGRLWMADVSCNIVFEGKQILLNLVLKLGIKMGSRRQDISFAIIFSRCREESRKEHTCWRFRRPGFRIFFIWFWVNYFRMMWLTGTVIGERWWNGRLRKEESTSGVHMSLSGRLRSSGVCSGGVRRTYIKLEHDWLGARQPAFV